MGDLRDFSEMAASSRGRQTSTGAFSKHSDMALFQDLAAIGNSDGIRSRLVVSSATRNQHPVDSARPPAALFQQGDKAVNNGEQVLAARDLVRCTLQNQQGGGLCNMDFAPKSFVNFTSTLSGNFDCFRTAIARALSNSTNTGRKPLPDVLKMYYANSAHGGMKDLEFARSLSAAFQLWKHNSMSSEMAMVIVVGPVISVFGERRKEEPDTHGERSASERFAMLVAPDEIQAESSLPRELWGKPLTSEFDVHRACQSHFDLVGSSNPALRAGDRYIQTSFEFEGCFSGRILASVGQTRKGNRMMQSLELRNNTGSGPLPIPWFVWPRVWALAAERIVELSIDEQSMDEENLRPPNGSEQGREPAVMECNLQSEPHLVSQWSAINRAMRSGRSTSFASHNHGRPVRSIILDPRQCKIYSKS